ncbi:MAG: hypothetical protein HY701_14035 [Gemmatimonadetes bacterium]|nr:hypothetical protein [Gemmatimonadota bacterium]
MTKSRLQPLRLTAAVLTVLLSACVPEDLNDRILGPGDAERAFNFTLSSGLGFGLPGGSFAIPKTPGDLFRRSTGRLGFFRSSPFWVSLFVPDSAWVFEDHLRNGRDDARLPRLQSTTLAWGRFAGMWPEPFHGVPNAYNLYAEVQGLKPNASYTVMFVRYGLRIAGRLDAENVLRGLPPDQPDELVPLGGSPGGTPNYRCNLTVAGAPVVRQGINPFVLGYIITDASGGGFIDCLIFNGGIWYTADSRMPNESSRLPFGANEFASFALPSYNYLVIVEGRSNLGQIVPTGPHVGRAQMAPDLDLDGDPIPNALAPFPTQAGTLPPVEVTMPLRPLARLQTGSAYTFWAVNTRDGFSAPLVGDYFLRNEEGETVDSALNVSSLRGGGSLSDQATFTVRTAAWKNDILRFNAVVVARTAPAATQPGTATVLFARFSAAPGDHASFVTTAPLNFGTMSQGQEADRVFGAYSGEGRGHFFGDELRLALQGLTRPPLGYYYEAWLVNPATGVAASLGPLTTPTPPYASLQDADLNASLAPTGLIADAGLRVLASQAGVSFPSYTRVYVTLSPKTRDGLPLHVALLGDVPGQVLGR